jgi:serine/threonine protein kinase
MGTCVDQEPVICTLIGRKLDAIEKFEEDARVEHESEEELLKNGGFTKLEKLSSNEGRCVYYAEKYAGSPTALKVKKFTRVNLQDLEIECLLRLEHENVVQLNQWYILENTSSIVLEFKWSNSQTLLSLLKRDEHALSESAIKSIFTQLVKAVSYAHDLNICHRDLKLENIFVHDDEKLIDLGKKEEDYLFIIGDWGYATFFSWEYKSLTRSCGSLHYASPEILKTEEYVGPEVDMWSLGVILYILATKRMPFSAHTGPELKEKVLKGFTRFPQNVEMSQDFWDLLKGLLDLDSDNRLTCEELSIHPWLVGHDIFDNGQKNKRNSCSALSSSSVDFKLERPDSPLLSRIGDLESRIRKRISKTKKEPQEENDWKGTNWSNTCSESRDFFNTRSFSTEGEKTENYSDFDRRRAQSKLMSESASLPNVREFEFDSVKMVRSSPTNVPSKKGKEYKKKKRVLGIFKRISPRKKEKAKKTKK